MVVLRLLGFPKLWSWWVDSRPEAGTILVAQLFFYGYPSTALGSHSVLHSKAIILMFDQFNHAARITGNSCALPWWTHPPTTSMVATLWALELLLWLQSCHTVYIVGLLVSVKLKCIQLMLNYDGCWFFTMQLSSQCVVYSNKCMPPLSFLTIHQFRQYRIWWMLKN
jgi:hypothetical protein